MSTYETYILMVVHIENKAQFDNILSEANKRSDGPGLIVVDFFATWCKPCSAIAPVFSELSQVHPHVTFLKVDVDQHEDIASEYGIRSLPTFLFFRGSKMIDQLLGPKPDALRNKLKELTRSDSSDTTSQSGSQSGGQPSLSPFLDTSQCECLNENDVHSLSRLLASDATDGYLLSDTDAQLVIFITFTQFVKIRSIQINGPEDSGPKTVRLFLNQASTPDFSACETADAVQEFTLETKDLEDGAITPLNYVKFQKVTTLTIFIADNQQGTDVTRIDKLLFYGSPVNTTNMQNFKRVAGKSGEAHS